MFISRRSALSVIWVRIMAIIATRFQGELELNEDEWPDWDEDVHGPMDTEENRRQFPENFTWSCCDRDGTQPGCTEGEHEPEEVQPRQKRARRY